MPGKQRGWVLAGSVGITGIAAGMAGFCYDFSWDGEWYHQTAILSLAGGWDPVTEPMRPFLAPLQEWVRHYPKASWYAAAAIFRATGIVELGKMINGLAFAAMLCAVLGAALDGGMRRGRARALAIVVAVNPVVLSELTTYLVDEIMFAFLVVAAAATWTCLAGRIRPAVFVAGISAGIACINAKFTGLVFLCFVAAAAALWCLCWRRKKFRGFVVTAAITVTAGTCIWGYNPYVTNLIHRGNSFYPIFGTDRFPGRDPGEANEKGETPKNLVAMGRVERFGYSIFGRPGNQPYREGRDASLMWPFGAQSKDLYAYTYHETRVAGFGPFFSAAFTLSSALGVWLLATDRRRWMLALMSGAIIGSLLISKALWWPRYGPQLWLLPTLPLMFVFGHARARGQMVAAWVLAGLLIVNAGVVGWVRLRWETAATLRLRGQLAEMRESGLTYDVSTRYFSASADERLSEAGVKFHDVGDKRGADWKELMSVVEGYPLANRYHPAADRP
jgi:4-amino-4-deoxy-L-arabinose transferase-like glycosyltransferase